MRSGRVACAADITYDLSFLDKLSFAAVISAEVSVQYTVSASESDLYALIERKRQRKELVGLVLYYRDTEYGITLLADSTSQILIMPNINRKTLIEDDSESITDVSWYIERIIQKLIWYNCGVDAFKFEEYTD